MEREMKTKAKCEMRNANELQAAGREILGKEPAVCKFRIVTEEEEIAQRVQAKRDFGLV